MIILNSIREHDFMGAVVLFKKKLMKTKNVLIFAFKSYKLYM